MTILSPREIEVFTFILDGKSDWEIAQILAISAKTVNYHVENAKRKLDAGTRIRAIALALRDGLIAYPAKLTDPIELDDPRRARCVLPGPHPDRSHGVGARPSAHAAAMA
jgi:DNA-binding CsgD family transcriptional regulator